jgi:membrane associated rhomboid family serine protease
VRKELISSALIPAILVVVFVCVKLLEVTLSTDLVHHGVYPRSASGLVGILLFPFIHADWKHLFNNSSAIFVLGTMLYFFYRPMASKTLLWVYLLSGVWLWVGGRSNYHIGASAIVYGLFGFLFVSGLLRRHLKLMALSLLVVFLYGSLVWGIFPIDHQISYEGHLFGLLAGLVVALVYRHQGPQQPKYSWELVEEEEVPDWYPDPDKVEKNENRDQLNIRYIYRPNEHTQKGRD